MTYPPEITTRVRTFGGATGLESGSSMSLSVTVKAVLIGGIGDGLIWAANGWQYPSVGVTVKGEPGAEVSVPLPVTDLPGWRSRKLNGLIDVSAPDSYSHRYQATITVFDDGRPIEAYTSELFVQPTGDLTPIDHDTSVTATTVQGGVVSIPDSWGQIVTQAQEVTDSLAVTAATEPAPPPPHATFLGDEASFEDSATYTFTLPFGDEAPGRTIVALFTARKSPPGALVTSATIGGTPAVVDVAYTDAAAAGTSGCIIRAVVPSGATGTIAITLDGVATRCHIAAWAVDTPVTLASSATAATGTTGGVTTPTTITLQVEPDDIIISGTHGSAGATETNWQGITRRYDTSMLDGASIMTVSGGHRQADLPGSHQITRTPVSAVGYVAHVAAAYRRNI